MTFHIEELDGLLQRLEQLDTRLARIEAVLTAVPRPADKRVMNVDEVAAFTGYAKKYIYHLTGAHRIPHYKRDGKIVFMRDEITKWLRETKIRTDAELTI